MTNESVQTVDANDEGWEWAIVEIFGHRRHAGRARQEDRFGTKMLRIDVPVEGNPDEKGWSTHYYGGSSIFSYSLTDEASALRANKPWAPPSRVSLPAPEDHYDDYFGGEDGEQ